MRRENKLITSTHPNRRPSRRGGRAQAHRPPPPGHGSPRRSAPLAGAHAPETPGCTRAGHRRLRPAGVSAPPRPQAPVAGSRGSGQRSVTRTGAPLQAQRCRASGRLQPGRAALCPRTGIRTPGLRRRESACPHSRPSPPRLPSPHRAASSADKHSADKHGRRAQPAARGRSTRPTSAPLRRTRSSLRTRHELPGGHAGLPPDPSAPGGL